GGQRLHAPHQLVLSLGQPALEHRNGVVPLTLEPRSDLPEALLEPLRSRVRDLAELVRKHAARLALERRDCPFHLAGEPLRCVFAGDLDFLAELLRCNLRVTRARAVDHPLELVELLSLDLGEPRRDPLGGIRLLAFDLLTERLLASAKPLCDLVQRTPALDALRLQLGVRVLHRLFDRAPELFAHPGNRDALLVALADDSLRIRRDPGFDLCDQLTVSLADQRDLLRESLLNAVEVVGPFGEAPLHLLLRRAERSGELVAELCLARDHRAPP